LTPSPGFAGSSPSGEQLALHSSPKGEVARECATEGVNGDRDHPLAPLRRERRA